VLTIGLVVMAILLFLRNLYATVIPSVTVPLSLIAVLIPLLFMGDVVGGLFRWILTYPNCSASASDADAGLGR
jgi:multidrug efflux pump subunit AcrB